MEATAIHDFQAQRHDELPFFRNSTLHVISMDEDPNWYKARQGDREGVVPKNYLKMRPNHWYVPNCSRREAELRLLEKDSRTGQYIQPDGAFVLRQSENNPGKFSISVKEGVYVLHFRVFFEPPGNYFIWTSKFTSVNDLIEHHRSSTIYGLHTLLLKDPIPSKTFGGTGMGPEALQQHGNGAPPPQVMPPPAVSSPKASNVAGRFNQPMDQPQPQQQPNLPPGLSSSQLAGQVCVAMYDFKPGFKEELAFKRGDRIRILGEEDANWWLGEIIDPSGRSVPGQQGLFPANYVQLEQGGPNPAMRMGQAHPQATAAYAK